MSTTELRYQEAVDRLLLRSDSPVGQVPRPLAVASRGEVPHTCICDCPITRCSGSPNCCF